jgi:hypothetical protein
MILLLYTAIILPYSTCFIDEEIPFFDNFDLVLDAFFMLDIIINFFSAYNNETGVIIDDFKLIISNYLQFWFYLDFISSIPIELISAQNTSTNKNQIKNIKIYKLVRLFRLIKMIRVLKYVRIINSIFILLKINLSLGKLISIFFTTFLCVHLIACLWYLIVKLDLTPINWLTEAGIQDRDHLFIYVTSVYWAFTTIFTVGFGDIHPTNNVERIICIIWMIFGAGFYSYSIGNLITIIQNFNKKESLISSKINQIEEFTSKIQLNKDLGTKIKSFFEHKFS